MSDGSPSIIEKLRPPERRAVALVGLIVKMRGGIEGQGAFTGPGRYGVLSARMRLCAERAASVREFWDKLCRRMLWEVAPQSYDDAALELIGPDADDADVLRALADNTQSIIMIARSLLRRDRKPRAAENPQPDPLATFLAATEPSALMDDGIDDLFGDL